jgi:hypothetical protein
LKLQAEFVKKGLGAGDTAVAVLNVRPTNLFLKTNQGGIPSVTPTYFTYDFQLNILSYLGN